MNMFEADGFKKKNHKILHGSYGIDNKNEILAHSTTYENSRPLHFLVADVHIQHFKMCAK